MSIKASECEVGDFILAASVSSPNQVIAGIVLRPMTQEEVQGRFGNATEGVWVILGQQPAAGPVPVGIGPAAEQVLSVIKSHKVAADDLGPLAGLAEG